MGDYIVVLVTASSKKEAKKITNVILEKKIAACVNMIPGIKSLFHWKGKIDKASEVLLIIKTRKDLFKKLEKIVKQNHSYAVPEIIALSVVQGSKDYLDWIDNVTLSK